MMNVKELIRELEKMPGDAKVLAHQPEAGGFIRIEKVDLKDGEMFEGIFGKQVVILDKKPFVPRKEQNQEEELENLCPGCNVFCEERFTDGQCK